MLFNKEGLILDVHLHINGEQLETVQTFRFLGINVDSTLSFQAHYSQVYDKLVKSTFKIRQLARILPLQCLLSLYFAFDHAHLLYGMTIWYPLLSTKAQNSIHMLQKRLIRTLGNANVRQHCMPLFKKFNILTIPDMSQCENLSLIYRIYHRIAPVPLLNLFMTSSSQVTRHGNIVIPKHKLAKVNRSFLCKPIMQWQTLSTNTKLLQSKKSFS